jgi:hypothetical protein
LQLWCIFPPEHERARRFPSGRDGQRMAPVSNWPFHSLAAFCCPAPEARQSSLMSHEHDDLMVECMTIVGNSKAALYWLNRSIQITAQALHEFRDSTYNKAAEDALLLKYSQGFDAENNVLVSEHQYTKEEFLNHLDHLHQFEVALTGVYHLVSHMEAAFFRLTSSIIKAFPSRLGDDRQMRARSAFEANSLEDLQARIIESFCTDLAFKNPVDYAKTAKKIYEIDISDFPEFTSYLEVKATRDIFIHNLGIANDIYQGKAKGDSRAANGVRLPLDPAYFNHAYHVCLVIMNRLNLAFESKISTAFYERPIIPPSEGSFDDSQSMKND